MFILNWAQTPRVHGTGITRSVTDSAAAASEFFGPTSLTGDNGEDRSERGETESAIDRASEHLSIRGKGLFISPFKYRSVCMAVEDPRRYYTKVFIYFSHLLTFRRLFSCLNHHLRLSWQFPRLWEKEWMREGNKTSFVKHALTISLHDARFRMKHKFVHGDKQNQKHIPRHKSIYNKYSSSCFTWQH